MYTIQEITLEPEILDAITADTQEYDTDWLQISPW